MTSKGSSSSAGAQIHAAFGDGPLSTASTRLRALATLSGSLTDALDPEDAAALVEQKALSALGASSAVVLTIGTFPPAIGQVADPQKSDALTMPTPPPTAFPWTRATTNFGARIMGTLLAISGLYIARAARRA